LRISRRTFVEDLRSGIGFISQLWRVYRLGGPGGGNFPHVGRGTFSSYRLPRRCDRLLRGELTIDRHCAAFGHHFGLWPAFLVPNPRPANRGLMPQFSTSRAKHRRVLQLDRHLKNSTYAMKEEERGRKTGSIHLQKNSDSLQPCHKPCILIYR